MLDPRLLEGSPPYDVLFCRNLLIYLGASARACVLAAIDRLLAADGVLFIGHADRLDWAGAEPKFTRGRRPGLLCLSEGGSRRARSARPCRPGSTSSSTPPPMSELRSRRVGVSRRPGKRRGGPCRSAVDQPLSLLDQAAELANLGRFDEAIAACERHLQQKGPGASAYYLMGMICQAAGDRPRAEECFNKTVYLDPRHDEALLALALLAERRGDHEAAAGFRRRAERIATMTVDEGDRK